MYGVTITDHHRGRTAYPKGHKPSNNRYSPHQGEKEIARRLRQRKRLFMKYMLNGGFSRRGNEVGPFHV